MNIHKLPLPFCRKPVAPTLPSKADGAQVPAPSSLLRPYSSVTPSPSGPTGQHQVSLGPRSVLVHDLPKLLPHTSLSLGRLPTLTFSNAAS